MTLILPRSGFEYRALIVMQNEQPMAIILDETPGGNRFVAFKPDEHNRWHGLHVPGVEIELDETSINDPNGYQMPLGSMVRQDDKLVMFAHLESNYRGFNHPITVYDGLPPCAPQENACFWKWQVVLGSGDDKRVLYTVNIESQNSAT